MTSPLQMPLAIVRTSISPSLKLRNRALLDANVVDVVEHRRRASFARSRLDQHFQPVARVEIARRRRRSPSSG